MTSPRLHGALLAVLLLCFVAGCGSSKAGTRLQPTPASTATPLPPASHVLRSSAEATYLPKLSKPLAELIRSQAWFDEMTPAHLDLVNAIIECERAAGSRGETPSVLEAFKYASEQSWYADGLDEVEAKKLTGVFEAYTISLSDQRKPQIGPVLSSTLKYELVDVLKLPESGEIAVLVSADDPAVGKEALSIADDALPQIEQIVGAFPYRFVHITVTDLPELYAGLSYDEFIGIAPDAVDRETISHELTHTTLYGIFPTWFEEGFAYFMGKYLTQSLPEAVDYYTTLLKQHGIDTRLNIGPKPGYDFSSYIVDISTGFLFMNGLYEANGIEAVSETIRALRTKSFTDQDLVRTLVRSGSSEQQQRVQAFVCKDVIGTTRDYCAPGSAY